MDLQYGFLKASYGQLNSVNSYSSPPSPPYSEENFDSSSDESSSLDMASRMSGTSKKNFNTNSSEYLPQVQNQRFSKSKVYPNLIKGVTGERSNSVNEHTKRVNGWSSHKSNRKKGRKSSPRRNIATVNCNVCDNSVKGILPCLKKHLIFGPVICLDCNKVGKYCENFGSFEFDPKLSQQCPHHRLQFDCNPVDNFRTWVYRDMNEPSEETFRNALKEYIHLLDPLKDIPPWCTAIKKCESYIKFHSKLELANDSNPLLVSKEAQKVGQDVPTEIIALPANGHYLIVKEAIEECPDCYEKINIRDLKFIIETCLIYTVCKGCGLHTYFVLDPPDGSAPKVQILKKE